VLLVGVSDEVDHVGVPGAAAEAGATELVVVGVTAKNGIHVPNLADL